MSDLIRKEDAIKTARLMIGLTADEREDEIRRIPSVEPEVGKWIKNERGLTCCSVCGKRPLQMCYYDIYLGECTGKDVLSKYCPECGAKMEMNYWERSD